MNKKQIQIQIFKALIDCNTRLCKAKVNDDEIMITTDGYSAFVLFEKECFFDLSRIPEKNGIAVYLQTDETEEEIFITNRRFVDRGINVVKIQGATYTVYANEKILNTFKNYRLFTNKDKSRVLVKNELGMTVGMFCVIRFNEEGV